MSGALAILIPVVLAAVLIVLLAGVISMLRGGAFNRKYGNKLMRLRVLVQFGAVLLIMLAMLIAGD